MEWAVSEEYNKDVGYVSTVENLKYVFINA